MVPFGAWSGESWADIDKHVTDDVGEFGPVAQVLVCDGEEGMIEGVGHLAEQHQRCHWHLPRDLNYMMWRDGAGLDVRKLQQKALVAMQALEVPEEDVEAVSDENYAAVEHSVVDAERQLADLVKFLASRGYSSAATYVGNAARNLFRHVRFWLKYGIVAPRTASLIERPMREVGRRLKKIGFGWTECNAAQMTCIIIKRIMAPGGWDDYWREKLGISGNVKLVFTGARPG
jgi:hypothetical protein